MKKEDDILKKIEKDFLGEPGPGDPSREQEMDPIGLKRWEIEFIQKDRSN